MQVVDIVCVPMDCEQILPDSDIYCEGDILSAARNSLSGEPWSGQTRFRIESIARDFVDSKLAMGYVWTTTIDGFDNFLILPPKWNGYDKQGPI
jgi:hypothetical protein